MSYSGVSKTPDGELYISGATSYFIFSQPWVRKCTVDGMQLNCIELSESPKAATSSMGTATPQPSASAAPAPAPEPPPADSKAKK